MDVHGSTHLWTKWIKTPEHYDVDVIMLCGDLTGKSLTPLVEQNDGSYTTYYFDKEWNLKNETEIKEMEDKIASAGGYSIRCTKSEMDELKSNPVKVDEIMEERIEKRMKEWLNLLVERINTDEVSVVVMPGNDDTKNIDSIIKSYDDVIYPLKKVVDIDGFELISMDYSSPTPWDTPRETSEEGLKKKIEKEVDRLSDPKRSIFNFHCPPYNTDLDKAPELTEDKEIVTTGGEPEVEYVGSKSVREMEEKYQPVLGLHGHIHESHGEDKINETLILNPGSEYNKGILRGFVVNLSQKKGIESYWKVEG